MRHDYDCYGGAMPSGTKSCIQHATRKILDEIRDSEKRVLQVLCEIRYSEAPKVLTLGSFVRPVKRALASVTPWGWVGVGVSAFVVAFGVAGARDDVRKLPSGKSVQQRVVVGSIGFANGCCQAAVFPAIVCVGLATSSLAYVSRCYESVTTP